MFTLWLNAAKRTDYIEKCFKQKLHRNYSYSVPTCASLDNSHTWHVPFRCYQLFCCLNLVLFFETRFIGRWQVRGGNQNWGEPLAWKHSVCRFREVGKSQNFKSRLGSLQKVGNFTNTSKKLKKKTTNEIRKFFPLILVRRSLESFLQYPRKDKYKNSHTLVWKKVNTSQVGLIRSTHSATINT